LREGISHIVHARAHSSASVNINTS